MRTVQEFKDFMLKRAGVQKSGQLKSRAEKDFWRKLNDLGWEKKTKSPDETPNIDAVAPLTDAEWDQLVYELQQLR